jgi:hypothetical protein
MLTVEDIHVYIFSWKKVTANATALYRAIGSVFPNTTFINCDETVTMPSDIRTIQCDDSFYYGRQFDTAIQHAPVGAHVGCIVGDVDPVADWAQIATTMVAAFNKGTYGIIAPNVDYTWHVARAALIEKNIYAVPNTDCTCWFLHPKIVNTLRSLDIGSISNLGWGIDTIAIWESLKNRLYVGRDYDTLVRQPKGTAYNTAAARVQMNALVQAYKAKVIGHA